jgi:hypothetical protein
VADDKARRDAPEKRTSSNLFTRRLSQRGMFIAIAVVLFAFFLAAVAVTVISKTTAPADAAATYGDGKWITEDEVTSYVEASRVIAGADNATDEAWSEFLDDCGLTPEQLRSNAIRQIVSEKLIEEIATERGLSASSDEIADAMAADTQMPYSGSVNSDVIAIYRATVLRNKVCEQDVAWPQVGEDEVREYLQDVVPNLNYSTVKRVYRFTIDEESTVDSTGSSSSSAASSSGTDELFDVRKECKKFRKQLLSQGKLTEESFGAFVEEHSNEKVLVRDKGDDGWSFDTSNRGTKYRLAVASNEKGDVTPVFEDVAGWSFLWIADEYEFPSTKKGIEKLDLSELPSDLRDVVYQNAALALWKQSSEEYVAQLVNDANVQISSMPDDVPYNVTSEESN